MEYAIAAFAGIVVLFLLMAQLYNRFQPLSISPFSIIGFAGGNSSGGTFIITIDVPSWIAIA